MKIIDGDDKEIRNFDEERKARQKRLEEARARGDLEEVKRIEEEISAEPNDIPRPAIMGGKIK